MFFIKYAFKNVFRKKGRTFLTLIPIIFGTSLLIWTVSLIEGLNRDSFGNIIDCQTAHIKIFHKDYDFEKSNDNIKYTFLFDDTLKNYLNNIETIKSFTPLLVFNCELSDGINKLPIVIYSIDSTYSNVFSTFYRKSDTIIPLPVNNEIIIGKGLNNLFEFNKNTPVYIETRTKHGTFDAIQLKFLSAVRSGNPEIDMNVAFINIKTAKKFMDTNNEINAIAIKLKDEKYIDNVKNQIIYFIQKHKRNLKVIDWKTEKKDFFAFAMADRVSGYIFISIILIIAGIGIANTMLLSVYERIKEIGTIRAIGSNRKIIMKIFLIESAIIGILGAIIGGILGGILMYYSAYYGIDIALLYSGMDIGYPVDLLLKGTFNLNIIFKTILYTAIIAILAGIYPAYRANKERISEIFK